MSEIRPIPIVVPSKGVEKLTVFDIFRNLLYYTYYSSSNEECLSRVIKTKNFLENVLIPIQHDYVNLYYLYIIGFTIALIVGILTILIVEIFDIEYKHKTISTIILAITSVMIIISIFSLPISIHSYFSSITHLNDLKTIDNMLTTIINLKTCKKSLILNAIKLIESWK